MKREFLLEISQVLRWITPFLSRTGLLTDISVKI